MSTSVTESKKRVAAARARLAEAKRQEQKAERELKRIGEKPVADSPKETLVAAKGRLDEARTAVADAEAELEDAEASLDNTSRDLIDESRIDDNVEQVIKALAPQADTDLRTGALHEALQALSLLRAQPPTEPIKTCAAEVEDHLRRCVARLLDLAAVPSQAAPPGKARTSATVTAEASLRLPDELVLSRSTPSAWREDRYPIRGLSVLYNGRRGELFGTLYLSKKP